MSKRARRAIAAVVILAGVIVGWNTDTYHNTRDHSRVVVLNLPTGEVGFNHHPFYCQKGTC